MRREIGLFERLGEWANLELALHRALKGKRDRSDARAFLDALPGSLVEIGRRLRTGAGPVGDFREFTIWDPKKRLISAPCFPDRVLHHAVMNVCEPVFDRWLVSQTHACRVGKGLRGAVREAERWAGCRKWYLQLDVRHYFETVPRGRLMAKLERLFGETAMLQLWWDLIDSHRPGEKRGMPIGALPSQHLANFYLGFLDRFIKETLRARAFVRYMDDMVLWHDDKTELLRWREAIRGFTEDELDLELKEPVLNRTSGGMDFLGFRFHPGWIGLNRRSRQRLKLRLRSYAEGLTSGRLTEAEAQQRATACLAFVEPAKSLRFRRRVIAGSGAD